MSIIAGDWIEIGYSHPTLGNGFLFALAGEDGTLDLGGFRSEDDANAIAGNGQMIDKMKRVRWSFEVPVKWDAANDDDLAKITALAESRQEAEYTFSHQSGAGYAATGKPVGDIQGSGAGASITLKLQGGGKARKVAVEL